MSSVGKSARILRGRFLAREDGATAVEFGLVAAPFFALLLVIMEAGLHYYSEAALDTALRQSSRGIQIGAVSQGGGTGAAAFKADFCSRLPNLMTCSRVHVDVRTVKARNIDNNFENVASPRGGNQFCPGVGGSYVIVRATYQVPTLFPFAVTEKITVDGASVYIVQAARVFRNELFKGGVGGC